MNYKRYIPKLFFSSVKELQELYVHTYQLHLKNGKILNTLQQNIKILFLCLFTILHIFTSTKGNKLMNMLIA